MGQTGTTSPTETGQPLLAASEDLFFHEAVDPPPETSAPSDDEAIDFPSDAASESSRPAWLGRRSETQSEKAALVAANAGVDLQLAEPVTESAEAVSSSMAETIVAKSPPESAVSTRGAPSRRAKPAKKSRFQPKSNGPKGPELGIAVESDDDEPLPWKERAVRWVLGVAGAGYGLSVLLHLIFFGSLSVVVVTSKAMNSPGGLEGFNSPGAEVAVDGVENGSIDPGGSSGLDELTAPIEMPNVEVVRSIQNDLARTMSPEAPAEFLRDVGTATGNATGKGKGTGNGVGDGTGDGKGLPFAMPQGGGAKVTRKGRFTAWTDPQDPEPGQNYRIIIQIELPDNIKRLPKRDLVGSYVKGTDSYLDTIPNDTRGFFPGNSQRVQVVVFVPGASALVKDTIKIKSRLLKEEQTLEIVF